MQNKISSLIMILSVMFAFLVFVLFGYNYGYSEAKAHKELTSPYDRVRFDCVKSDSQRGYFWCWPVTAQNKGITK
jgi:hypothetical protein